jgi:SNF2 family DNA or RNA helicase
VFINELRKRGNALRMLVGELKIAGIIEWINSYLEETNEKLIVFGIHYRVLKPLYHHFQKISVLVNGEVTQAARDAAERRFHTDPNCRLLFGNIRAAGEAWSCKCTSTTAFVELDWVPGAHSQAEDRVYGVGRGLPGVPALAYYLLAFNTMEERMCRLLQAKQKDIDLAMDGKVTKEGVNLFDQVMKMLYEEVHAGRTGP